MPKPRLVGLKSPRVPRKPRFRFCSTIVLVMAYLTSLVSVARANCNDDCKNEYLSALNECRSEYEQSKDLQDLEECLADSRSEYDDCVDDCNSLGAGGVMAYSSRGRVELTSFCARSPAIR